MYPDPEHFYNEDDYIELFCPKINDRDLAECLKTKKAANNTDDENYKKCMSEESKRYTKCLAEKSTEFILHRHLEKTTPKKCDKVNVVYSLNRDESNFANKIYHECNRPFVVHKIAYSNLILLKTNRLCGQVFAVDTDFNDVPRAIKYYGENSSLFCYKHSKPQLFRSRPKSCVTKHEKVSLITVQKMTCIRL